jgi:limonene-1,2-epoxide hydrolase
LKPAWGALAEKTLIVEAVRAVEVAYCAAFDRADRDALRQVFDPDALFRRPQHTCTGVDEILALFERMWNAGTQPTRHFPVVVQVEELADEVLRARVSYFVILGHGDDLYAGWGDYDDRLAVRGERLVILEKSSAIQGLFKIDRGWQTASSTPPPWL